ncbi:MAG TPA: ABC transporter substrate-binding protein [Dehalococcoidia bacterium]
MSYWDFRNARFSRRRALAGTVLAGVGVSAAAVVGCGGDSKSSGSSGGTSESSNIYTPVDTSAKVKPGGTLKASGADASTLDILSTSNVYTQAFMAYTYPKLLKVKSAKYPDLVDTSQIVGDLAQSSEVSDDKLQVTLKLRQGLKWDARSPTSGREIDSSDVAFSWNKFAQVSPQRTSWVGSSGNNGAVASFQAVDKYTVVFKLTKPNSTIIPLFASPSAMYIMPKESDGGFDPKATARGYGPYLLDEYRPSETFTFKKAPDYYEKGLPYIDRLEFPFVTEYATRLAQFRAGGIYTPIATANDIIQLKKDIAALNISRAGEIGTLLGATWMGFGYEGPPFNDERVRQAASYLFDRKTFADVFSNRQAFENEGYPVELRYDSHIPATYTGFWRDPLDAKAFGANSKFYNFNTAEAKKLLTAAGYPNGVDTQLHVISGQEYGPDYSKQYQAMQGMMQDGGIRLQVVGHQYGPIDWHVNIYYGYSRTTGSGKGFTGMAYSAEYVYPVYPLTAYARLNKNGERYHGFAPAGGSAFDGDPYVNDATEKMLLEFDVKKQAQIAQDMDSYISGHAYLLPAGYGSRDFRATWPVIQNYGLYADPGTTTYTTGYYGQLNWWLDETKPPLGKA